jgi:hypothetical protein
MRQCGFDDRALEVGLVAGPVPERRPDTVCRHRETHAPMQHVYRHHR